MTTQTIKFHMKPETFKQNAAISLQDKPLRKSLRTAMDMLMTKRKAVLTDEEELQSLRDLCEHVRQRSLSKLPALLEQLVKPQGPSCSNRKPVPTTVSNRQSTE